MLDIRALVVDELCRDKRVLVNLFQAVGHAELKYLCNSGLWFGAMLGLIQMVQYALYPAKWTIPFGGLLVSTWGYKLVLCLHLLKKEMKHELFDKFVIQALHYL